MKINKNNFLSIVKILQKAVSSKSSIEEFKCLYFNKDYLYTTNGKIIIQYPFKTDIECFVDIEKVLKYLEKEKNEEIDIKLCENILTFISKKTKFELNVFQGDLKFKIINNIENWEDLPSYFYEGIKHSIFSTTLNEINQIYEYLNILFFKKNKIFSTNNKKISQFEFEKNLKYDFSISNNLANVLIQIPDILKYTKVNNTLYFKTKDDMIIQCLNRQVEMPDFFKFLEMPEEKINLNFHELITDGLDLCNVITSDFHDNEKKIYIEIKGNELICYSKSEKGKIQYKSKLNTYYDNEISFIINPTLLLNIINDNSFSIYYSEKLKRIWFKNDKYLFVIQTVQESV